MHRTYIKIKKLQGIRHYLAQHGM